MEKGISIYYSPEDLKELHEFIQWKTRKAAGLASVESNFDLREGAGLKDAAALIKQAQLEKQQILRQIEAERGSQRAVEEQRENVSLLPDREAQRIQAEWIEQAAAQASRYCQSKNAGATPKASDPNNKEEVDIRNGVKTWIESKRKKNWFKKSN
jgi:hypothetical protein